MISDQLKQKEFHKEGDEDKEEHQTLKRLYKLLAIHEIGNARMSSIPEAVKCNSLLYKALYSAKRQNKEEILTIASFCS